MRRMVSAIVLFGLGATILIAAPKVQVQRDPKFDFSRLKTWEWSPDGAGNVKVWVTAQSKSEPVKRQYGPVIMKAVEDELSARGFTRASGTKPDFNMTYYVLVTLGSASQEMGEFLPAVTQWGLPPFTAQTTALRVYPMGTLVLDLATEPGGVVWRGVTQAEIDMDRTEPERAKRITSKVHDVIAKVPNK
jgi:hypothetical protein